MKLTAFIRPLQPKSVFRISRANRSEVHNVFAQIESEGVTGHGEASPNSFYGETAQNVLELLGKVGPYLSGCKIRNPADIERIWEELWPIIHPSRAAQCALDLALWDWLASQENTTIFELVHGHPLRPIPTFVTLGLSSPEELANKLAPIRDWPLIKIKSDSLADLAPIRFVREHSTAKIAVDANCAWTGHDLSVLVQKLAQLGVLFLEQPLPPGLDLPPELQSGLPLPVLADESCVILQDVEKIPGRFSGINIKLVKCGGLTPALKMARRGRELGLITMTGCMLESSLLISAGAVVAQTTDYADLDGSWLLKEDPFDRVQIKNGVVCAS
jgi:L-alanine-DL-glutamate epimerase-like enolase superfamily enzyme